MFANILVLRISNFLRPYANLQLAVYSAFLFRFACGNFWDLVVTSLQNKHTSAVQSRRNYYDLTALKNIFLQAYCRVYHGMLATLLQRKEDFYGSIARIKSFIYDVLCYKFLGKLLLRLKKEIFLLFCSKITTTYP